MARGFPAFARRTPRSMYAVSEFAESTASSHRATRGIPKAQTIATSATTVRNPPRMSIAA